MTKKYYPKPKAITIDLQIYNVQKYFKSFNFYRNNIGTFWIGELTPSNITYKIKIIYKYNKHPRVYVLSPNILTRAPHRYSDKSLCLYYPKDNNYNHKSSMICDTIIPWTAEWLYYYELWLKTGVWWGPEAPHGKIKRLNKKKNKEF